MNKFKIALKILLLGGVVLVFTMGHYISQALQLDKKVSADAPSGGGDGGGGGGDGGGGGGDGGGGGGGGGDDS